MKRRKPVCPHCKRPFSKEDIRAYRKFGHATGVKKSKQYPPYCNDCGKQDALTSV